LIDCDPQGSLASWWNERAAETPLFASVTIAKLAEHLQALEHAGIKLAIIDTPPAVTDMIRAVLKVADLVLIPTRPSPHDLRAVGTTVELVEQAGKKMVFVINGAAARAKIAGEAAVALSQHGTVAPVTLYQRTDFASSMIDGRTVQEIDPKSRSAEEVSGLWKYVSAQLRKI
jgi:chromosome partitioning protein